MLKHTRKDLLEYLALAGYNEVQLRNGASNIPNEDVHMGDTTGIGRYRETKH